MLPTSWANSHRLTLAVTTLFTHACVTRRLPYLLATSWHVYWHILHRHILHRHRHWHAYLHMPRRLQACFLTSLLGIVRQLIKHMCDGVWDIKNTGKCLTNVLTYLVQAQWRIQHCLRDLQDVCWRVRLVGQDFKALRTSWCSVRNGGGREKRLEKEERIEGEGTLTNTGTDSHMRCGKRLWLVSITFHNRGILLVFVHFLAKKNYAK